ncbi:MAG: hypothetical protein M3N53_14405 [Actinomycetota bacterium]|nr:hypothetical protein [Actinomycetota bacterium]
MTSFDVERDMTHTTLDDLDLVLSGGAVLGGDAALQELAHIVQQVQDAYPAVAIPPAFEDAHVAMIMHAVSETAAAAAVDAPPEPRASIRARSERMLAPWTRKIAAATLSLSTAFGGMAYAGVLPDPIQQLTADVAERVGVDLPAPADGAPVVEVDEHGPEDTTDEPSPTGAGSETTNSHRPGASGEASEEEAERREDRARGEGAGSRSAETDDGEQESSPGEAEHDADSEDEDESEDQREPGDSSDEGDQADDSAEDAAEEADDVDDGADTGDEDSGTDDEVEDADPADDSDDVEPDSSDLDEEVED